jgi:hypothetical protein
MGMGDLEAVNRSTRKAVFTATRAAVAFLAAACGPVTDTPDELEGTGSTGVSVQTPDTGTTHDEEPEIEDPDPCTAFPIEECPCTPVWISDFPNSCAAIPLGCFESNCVEDSDCRSWQSCVEVQRHVCPDQSCDGCAGFPQSHCLPVAPPEAMGE